MSASPLKFGLNYALTIQNTTGATLVVRFPFTIEFSIVRNTLAEVNSAQIRIVNLSQNNRNFLLKDTWDTSPTHALFVTLQAGYGDGPNWPVVFKGNVLTGYSVREGVDFISNLDCQDGGLAFQNGRTSFQFTKETTQADVIQALVEELAPLGVSVGAIDEAFNGVLSKGGSYSGNTLDILRQLTNGNYFIDNGKFNALLASSRLAGGPLLLDATAGLLDQPVRMNQQIDVKMLFEPRVSIGTVVDLQASTQQVFNGIHRVLGITHKGTISGALASDATTNLTLEAGTFTPVPTVIG